ncbi:MAG: radical SAM protein, partial [Deltaproteobacteria bacterium]
MKELRRKYYRLRPARYYGGIATADLVGCNVLCAYCWNYNRNLKPSECDGRYYHHTEIAKRLSNIARRKDFNRIRLSGAEPILGERSFDHLVGVLEEIKNID